VYGLHANGGMAEQVVVPASMCHLVPADLDPIGAAIAQPAAIGLHAVGRSQLIENESVVVIGAGGIGAFVIAGAASMQPSVLIAVDINEERLETASALGASTTVNGRPEEVIGVVLEMTNGRGADLVVEATGTPAGLEQALKSVRFGGRVLMVGIQAAPTEVDLRPVVVHEINLLTTNGHSCDSDLPRALDLLATSDLAKHVVGPVIRLDGLVNEGFQAMAEHTARGKVVVDLR
jgi:(R,R)-butanediol dehydrogenase/meso-butanediol dehydrogenase/diacetyl reductase